MLSPVALSKSLEKNINLFSSEYSPFVSENLKDYGPLADFVESAFKSVGYNVNINFLPWARGLHDSKKGLYDGVLTIWYRKEREKWFKFSKGFFPNEIVLIKKKKLQIKYEGLESLKDYSIGVIRGFSYPDAFKKAAFLNKSRSKNAEQSIKKLVNDRVDLIIMDKLVAKFHLNKKYPGQWKNYEVLGAPLKTDFQHLAISKKIQNYQKIIEDFNRGYQKIKASGEFKKILKKHGL